MLPSPDILNNYEHGKFVLANLAAKRAKQLKDGAPPLVSIDSNHPLTIALAEIAAGKIKAILPKVDDLAVLEPVEITISDEVLPAEFGMLLPALDESEVALIDAVAAEDDHDDELASETVDLLSLGDLPGEEEEVAPAAGEDETLSLSDIAEQETSMDDEEPEV